MSFAFRVGAIYNISYSQAKTNFREITVFVLFGMPTISKLCALNLNARQLNMLEKMRLVHGIVRLGKIPNINTYSGALLYRIMLTYYKNEVRKCYRTYWHHYITGAALVNYGLNSSEDFKDPGMRLYNPNLLAESRREFVMKIMNFYSKRGVEMKAVQQAMAQIQRIPRAPTAQDLASQEIERNQVTPEYVEEQPETKFAQIPSPSPIEPEAEPEEKAEGTEQPAADKAATSTPEDEGMI